MELIEKFLDKLAKTIEAILAGFLGTMLIVSVVEVVRRYFFGQSFSWSEELIRYLIIWVSFLGAAVTFKSGGLVCFDVLVNKLKGKNKTILLVLINTISLLFLSYAFYNSVLTVTKPSIVNQKSIGLQISMLYPFLAIPLGLGLMLIFALWNYVEIYRKKGPFADKRKSDPTKGGI